MTVSHDVKSSIGSMLLCAVAACAVPTEDPATSFNGPADSGIAPGLLDANAPDANATLDAGHVDAQEPEPDAEIPVDVAAAPAFAAAVANSPEQRLVVWVDERNGDQDIYGSRVDASGQILDPGGIAISSQAGNEHRPDVVWTGEHYLVAWMDRRDTGTRIYAARVDSDGSVLDPTGFALSPDGDFSQLPRLAADGAGAAVAVFEGPCGDQCTGVVAVSIASSGQASAGVVLAAGTGREPSIAFDGSTYLAAYTDFRDGQADVYARYLNSSGVAVGSELSIGVANGSQQAPTVAAGDQSFVVAWIDTQTGALEHAWSHVVGENVGARTGVGNVRWQDPPRVAFSSGAFLLVWTENSLDGASVETHVASIDEMTNQAGESVVYETPDGPGTDDKKPAISCSTQGCSIAWHQSVGVGRSVLGVLMSSTGDLLTAQPALWSTIPASAPE